MKKMKKLFAMLLTLAMVFGMSMTSFAAPAATAKITVKNLYINYIYLFNYLFISS